MRKKTVIILRPLAAALLLMLAIGAISETQAQREQSGTFRIVSSGGIALLPNEKARLTHYNPTPAPFTGHVKVFSGTGQILLSADNNYIGAGEFLFHDIAYTDLDQVPSDPQTGRRQIRVETTITYTGLESDARRIWSTYDLVNASTGQTILVGMLLPAIQKVR